MIRKLAVLVALSTPGISMSSQPAENRHLDDFMAVKSGVMTDVKNVMEDLNLAVKVEVAPVPIPDAEHPLWWVVGGQNLLEQKGVETFAKPGEIVVCSEGMGDCTMRYKVKIEDGINLSKAAAQMKDKNFETQMLQLSDLARRPPQISVTNEAGRIILRSQQ